MIVLKRFSDTSGWGITQPGLQLSPRWLAFAKFSRRFIGRLVTRMVLILSGVLIGLLIRLFLVLLLWVLIVWHVLPPRRGSRHRANKPDIGSFPDDPALYSNLLSLFTSAEVLPVPAPGSTVCLSSFDSTSFVLERTEELPLTSKGDNDTLRHLAVVDVHSSLIGCSAGQDTLRKSERHQSCLSQRDVVEPSLLASIKIISTEIPHSNMAMADKVICQ
jgi:hypothetical protein